MSLTIDVAVVAHDRYELTESCLRHLARQTRGHRTILTDDASTDGTAERVAAAFPDVHVIHSATSLGYARATNRAAAAGDADVVVALNNDVDCEPDFLEELVAPLERDAAVGSTAALCLRPGGERIDSVGLTCDVTLSPFPRLQGRAAADADSPAPVLTGPAGTAAAYRRAAWDPAGGLDERIFAYSEDFDLALRLRAAGWGTAAAPRARCVHVGSASFGHRSAFQRRHGGFSRGYLLRRRRLLRGPAALRTALTEALVIGGDAVISRDLAAWRGRLEGWRAAGGLPALPAPPDEAVDHDIHLRDAVALRRAVYARD